MSELAYPKSKRFSRQQLGSLARIPDDILGYWLTRGLLRPISVDGDAARRHRRFDYVQVHIAALLRELHAFGLNIGQMTSFAAALQHGVVAAHLFGVEEPSLGRQLSSLAGQIGQFRDGPRVGWISSNAASIPDVIARFWSLEGRDAPASAEQTRLSEIAGSLDPYTLRALDRYCGLVSVDNVVERAPGSRGEDWGEYSWLAWPLPDGGWEMVDTDVYESGLTWKGADRTRSAIYLAVSLIIRRIWSPAPETNQRELA